MNKCTYHISKHVQASCSGSLIDGGCNGGLAGDDVVVLEESTQLVDITGIADSKIELLESFINMQHMEKALQFTQIISFSLLVWGSMTSLPLVQVASNAFASPMAIKFPLLSKKVFAAWICVPQLMMNWLNYLMSS